MRLIATALLMALVMLVLDGGSAWAEGLPQLDYTKFGPQVVWLVISFAVLYWLMSRMALPRVAEVLEERRQRIDETIRKAEVLKAEAEAALKSYEQALSAARARAQDELRKANEDVAKAAAVRHQELTARLTDEVATAEARIRAARDVALGQVRGMSVEIAVAAVERLTGQRIDDKAVFDAVDSVLGDRP